MKTNRKFIPFSDPYQNGIKGMQPGDVVNLEFPANFIIFLHALWRHILSLSLSQSPLPRFPSLIISLLFFLIFKPGL